MVMAGIPMPLIQATRKRENVKHQAGMEHTPHPYLLLVRSLTFVEWPLKHPFYQSVYWENVPWGIQVMLQMQLHGLLVLLSMVLMPMNSMQQGQL
jgi:hypothetical protein